MSGMPEHLLRMRKASYAATWLAETYRYQHSIKVTHDWQVTVRTDNQQSGLVWYDHQNKVCTTHCVGPFTIHFVPSVCPFHSKNQDHLYSVQYKWYQGCVKPFLEPSALSLLYFKTSVIIVINASHHDRCPHWQKMTLYNVGVGRADVTGPAAEVSWYLPSCSAPSSSVGHLSCSSWFWITKTPTSDWDDGLCR